EGRHQLPDRAGRRLLRLSHQAPPVPGPVPRELPARGDQPRGDDPPRRAADAEMTLYLRILRYLSPHRGLFVLSIVSMTLYAALDAFSFTLLIPFLEVLFNGGGGTSGAAGLFGGEGSALQRFLDWAMVGLVEGVPPMEALRNVVL